MEEEHFLLLIGLGITTIPAIILSMWNETRFVGKTKVIVYGLSSIGFAFLYLVNSGLDNAVGQEAFVLFFGIGALWLFVRKRFPDIWKTKKSLPFSHKTIGGFQLAFMYFFMFH